MPQGRPLSFEKIQRIEKMIKEGHGWPDVRERFDIGFNTYCKIKRKIKKFLT